LFLDCAGPDKAVFLPIPTSANNPVPQLAERGAFLTHFAKEIGMSYQSTKYRFYGSREEYGGSDCFELWAGNFPEEEIAQLTREVGRYYFPALVGQPGAAIIGEDEFEIYLPALYKVMPNFEWYGWNKFTSAQCLKLLKLLESLQQRIKSAQSLEELKVICEGHLYAGKENFGTLKRYLIIMTDDFIGIIYEAIDYGMPLWAHGP
jgi:hypothetical protein